MSFSDGFFSASSPPPPAPPPPPPLYESLWSTFTAAFDPYSSSSTPSSSPAPSSPTTFSPSSPSSIPHSPSASSPSEEKNLMSFFFSTFSLFLKNVKRKGEDDSVEANKDVGDGGQNYIRNNDDDHADDDDENKADDDDSSMTTQRFLRICSWALFVLSILTSSTLAAFFMMTTTTMMKNNPVASLKTTTTTTSRRRMEQVKKLIVNNVESALSSLGIVNGLSATNLLSKSTSSSLLSSIGESVVFVVRSIVRFAVDAMVFAVNSIVLPASSTLTTLAENFGFMAFWLIFSARNQKNKFEKKVESIFGRTLLFNIIIYKSWIHFFLFQKQYFSFHPNWPKND